jgi:hypothetical protein
MQVIFNKFFKYCFPFPRWADSALYKINNTVMPILAGTIEFVHIEQVSALFMFDLGQVLLYECFISHLIKYNSMVWNIRIIIQEFLFTFQKE